MGGTHQHKNLPVKEAATKQLEFEAD